MMPTWKVYAINYDAALDLAERLDLNSGMHIEPSSQVIFGFANPNDAFSFRLTNHCSACPLHVLDNSGMVLVGAPVDCRPKLVEWLKDHLSSVSWGMTELVRASFSTDAERQQFETAL